MDSHIAWVVITGIINQYPAYLSSGVMAVRPFTVVFEMSPQLAEETLSYPATLGSVVSVLVTPPALHCLSAWLDASWFTGHNHSCMDHPCRKVSLIWNIDGNLSQDAVVGVCPGKSPRTSYAIIHSWLYCYFRRLILLVSQLA